jgi:hypothetical protein
VILIATDARNGITHLHGDSRVWRVRPYGEPAGASPNSEPELSLLHIHRHAVGHSVQGNASRRAGTIHIACLDDGALPWCRVPEIREQSRLILSRIDSAVAVQTKGLLVRL